MLATIGDLLEDVAVRIEGPIRLASDTDAHIARRRGGSAANVAVAVARLGHRARFIGQVGDDATGRALVDQLDRAHVDTSPVRFAGTTGAIVVLVDSTGERTMLRDRRACLSLDDPDPAWLEGVDVLHVPLYSLSDAPLATTTSTIVGWANARGIAVSIDASSTAVIDALGRRHVLDLLAELRPRLVLANADEAGGLGIEGAIAGALTVVKRGPDPAVLHRPDRRTVEVPAEPLDRVVDTTGAGDAFAAGFLTHAARTDWDDSVAACMAGHAAAAELLGSR